MLDIYFGITVFNILSIIGIISAVISLFISKKHIFGWIGLMANVLILIFAYKITAFLFCSLYMLIFQAIK